jgi:hypothetical protein
MRFAVRHNSLRIPKPHTEVPRRPSVSSPESCSNFRKFAKHSSVVAFALGLAGCGTAQQPITQNDTRSGLVETENAFAYPAPGGPTVQAVVQRHYSNAVEQEIVLETRASLPGQNYLRIQMFGPADTGRSNQGTLKQEFEPARNVVSEMRRLFPGVAMQRSLSYVQNKYGPFGYALGRSAGGDGCIYGWQRITSTGTTQVWVGNRGAIQIRLRLCEQGASQAELLSNMYDFTISSSFGVRNWNPYGDPAAVDPSFGRVSRPLYPRNVDNTVPAERGQPRRSQRRAVSAVQPVAPGTPPGGVVFMPAAIAPTGPMVPPPPDGRSSAQATQAPIPAPIFAAPANAAPIATAPTNSIEAAPILAAPANSPLVPSPPID